MFTNYVYFISISLNSNVIIITIMNRYYCEIIKKTKKKLKKLKKGKTKNKRKNTNAE